MAYFGALRYFAEHNKKFKRIAGTSAGAITAGLMAVGYEGKDLEDKLLDPETIMDYCEEVLKFYKEHSEFKDILNKLGRDFEFKDFLEKTK